MKDNLYLKSFKPNLCFDSLFLRKLQGDRKHELDHFMTYRNFYLFLIN